MAIRRRPDAAEHTENLEGRLDTLETLLLFRQVSENTKPTDPYTINRDRFYRHFLATRKLDDRDSAIKGQLLEYFVLKSQTISYELQQAQSLIATTIVPSCDFITLVGKAISADPQDHALSPLRYIQEESFHLATGHSFRDNKPWLDGMPSQYKILGNLALGFNQTSKPPSSNSESRVAFYSNVHSLHMVYKTQSPPLSRLPLVHPKARYPEASPLEAQQYQDLLVRWSDIGQSHINIVESEITAARSIVSLTMLFEAAGSRGTLDAHSWHIHDTLQGVCNREVTWLSKKTRARFNGANEISRTLIGQRIKTP